MTYEREPQTTKNRFDLLANYFRWSKGNGRNLPMNHLPRRPDIYMYRDGYEHLNRVLDLFEETILSRNIKDKSPEKIERMKRYFIYSLIGLDNPEYYKYMIERKITEINRYIVDSELDLELLEIK